jgi:hypothetical protein
MFDGNGSFVNFEHLVCLEKEFNESLVKHQHFEVGQLQITELKEF